MQRPERQGDEFTVIVPVGRDAPHLTECLASLRELDPAPAECIFVLDGHEDFPGSPQPHEVVIRTEAPSGPALARNLGAARARGELLLFVDADVEVPADALSRLRQVFAEDGELSAVFGSYDDCPSAKGLVSQWRNLLHHFVHQNSARDARTFWTGFGAFRAAAFAELGGFDEGYTRPCVEDIELGYRATAAGHRIRLESSLQVRHNKRWSLGAALRSDLLDRAIPWTALLLRRRAVPSDLNLRWRDRLATAAVGLALSSALLGALLDGGLYWWASGLALLVAVALEAPLLIFLGARGGATLAFASVGFQLLHRGVSGLGMLLGLLRAACSRAGGRRVGWTVLLLLPLVACLLRAFGPPTLVFDDMDETHHASTAARE
jgi:GT2 family glycosyltransferase